MIKMDNIKHIKVPLYEGLSLKEMLAFANDYPDAMRALPIENEISKLHRWYVGNLIHTIVGDAFQ